MHLVVVKSKHEVVAERGLEMQNFLDVYTVLVSNINYTVCTYETKFIFSQTL